MEDFDSGMEEGYGRSLKRIEAKVPERIGDVEVGTGKMPTMCASVIGKDPLNVLYNQSLAGADLLEIRLDEVKDYSGFRRRLSGMDSELELDIPILTTNRKRKEGGRFLGEEERRIEILVSMMEFADAVDIEISTADHLKNRVLDKAKEMGISVVASYHDINNTPGIEDIRRKLEMCLESGEIGKVAYTANNQKDVLKVLEACYEVKKEFGKPLCAISMGSIGSHSRVIGPIYGSDIVYAPIGTAYTAPGQIPISRMKSIMEDIL